MPDGQRKSACADLHFAPTPGARENLLREGVPEDRIVVTGNTVIDALLLARRMLEQKRAASARPDPGPEVVNDAPMVLVTLHRRENLRADRLAQVEEALVRLSVEEGCRVVFPAHPNPALSGLVQRLRGRHPNLQVIAPQTYVDFIGLLEDASMILSDSGGVQEEAAFLGKLVLIMRDSTERPEVLGAGTGQLVGTDAGTILAAVREILPGLRAGGPSTRGTLAFGTGGAAEMIVRHLMEQETSGLPGGDNVRQ
ncbi:UDP-N-acetyl glucosamine 2-epimerase [Novispirillum itersonii]|uniref:UDP-N-acetyl glucosamine 2-epimerase n=1 Tax=Novispirillum itersonii TaxID=189 RepID=UPI001608653A|nr:UDP-N-acetylglucosamine 2-epimerase [Novispirillum itersonii]